MYIKYKQLGKLSAFSLTFLLFLSGHSLTVSSDYISQNRPLAAITTEHEQHNCFQSLWLHHSVLLQRHLAKPC